MFSPEERERGEKIRSAFSASQMDHRLLMSERVINRYLAPPENTDYPLEFAYHLLGDVSGKTVLEYGCGDGPNTVVLCRRGAKVIGLDISEELLAVASQRLAANGCRGAELVLGSAHALPLQDESVDIVFGIAILHHLDLELASREVQRVLKKGGRAIFQEPLRNSKLLARVRSLFPLRSDVSPFERPLTDRELHDFAGPCEFKARTFQLMLSRLATLVPFGGSIEQLCENIDMRIMRLVPPLKYFGSIKVFEMVKLDQRTRPTGITG